MLRALRVAEIADSGQTYGGHAYHDCLDTAAAGHVPIVHPRAGDVWHTIDGITLRFIGPSLPFIGGKNAINDNSISFILTYRSFRMLFTGDAGIAAERRFLAEDTDLHADVLKVGHHGSAYSSSPEFISAVHPEYAVISVGRHNLFGHPAPSTVRTLAHADARICRTDQNGGTTIITDGVQTLTSVMVTAPAQGTCCGIVDPSFSEATPNNGSYTGPRVHGVQWQGWQGLGDRLLDAERRRNTRRALLYGSRTWTAQLSRSRYRKAGHTSAE